jgi:hypothetical protein
MKSQIVVDVVAAAIWLASPALNVQYVQWELNGSSQMFVSAVAIWLVSTLAMIAAFRRNDREPRKLTLSLLVAIVVLVVSEAVFWLTIDEYDNKPMLLRQSIGIEAGFGVSLLALIGAVWPSRALPSEWSFAHCARLIGEVVAGTVALELALFAVRTIFRRTHGYYAMDCSMFAIAALSIAVIIAVLCRCVPLNHRELDRT